MKSIEVKIDKVGRTVIPIRFRKALGIIGGDKLLLSMEEECIKITTNTKRCLLCKTKLSGKEKMQLCERCIAKILEENKNGLK